MRWRVRACIAMTALGASSRGWCAEPVDPATLSGVQVFLQVYQNLSQAHSAFFYELYSDAARITADVPDRPVTIFQGTSYKAWGKNLIGQGTAFPDGSRFDRLAVQREGTRIKVHAQRYSISRCYADPGYWLVLESYRNGYRIIEEHLALQPASTCVPEQSLVGAAENAPRSGTVPTRPAWRPLSSEDINAMATRLAQQAPGRSESAVLPRTSPPPAASAEPASPRRPSDLWISPPELP